jgi:outer membrane biosynthesis protein TonB
LAALATTGVHAVVVLLAMISGARGATRPVEAVAVTQMVEIALPPSPAPSPAASEPEPPPPPPAAVKAPPPAPKVRAPKPVPPQEAPPPAAAQAGQVLEAKADVVDFSETIVSGKGPEFAGGVTESGGTATHAVRDVRARAGGVEGGTGTNLDADRSRAPQLAGGARWDIPFPPEADDADIDHAVVTLQVSVDANGRVESVTVKAEPGYGFGRATRRYAEGKRWAAALDRAGRPIKGVTLINVRFDR